MVADSTAGPPGHVTPLRVYLIVFGLLMGLTALTVGVAFVDLGALNDVVALAIAATKATVVVLYFMHVAHASRLVQLTVVGGFLWLFILFSFTLSDVWTRGVWG